jgi:hypothetical protein
MTAMPPLGLIMKYSYIFNNKRSCCKRVSNDAKPVYFRLFDNHLFLGRVLELLKIVNLRFMSRDLPHKFYLNLLTSSSGNMEFLGSFIECYCRRSLDMKPKALISLLFLWREKIFLSFNHFTICFNKSIFYDRPSFIMRMFLKKINP